MFSDTRLTESATRSVTTNPSLTKVTACFPGFYFYVILSHDARLEKRAKERKVKGEKGGGGLGWWNVMLRSVPTGGMFHGEAVEALRSCRDRTTDSPLPKITPVYV